MNPAEQMTQNHTGDANDIALRLASSTEEPWLDKRALAEYLSCSVRSIEYVLTEGCPHAVIFGRAKFRVSEVEPWLEQHGRLERRGSDSSSNTTGHC